MGLTQFGRSDIDTQKTIARAERVSRLLTGIRFLPRVGKQHRLYYREQVTAIEGLI